MLKNNNYIDLLDEVKSFAKKVNAVILAHYYQEPEIQDLADFIGDSLELSKKAMSTDADIIVFCGVYFMAEVAKILNPEKQVLIPDLNARCSLADSCPAKAFEEFRKKYDDHIAITYINCSAEVKALSDIICTSSNAEKIIKQIPEKQKILFAPDKFLGSYLEKKTGRKMLIWPGTCVVHESFSERELIKLITRHKNAYVIAHPECPENLLNYADFIGSTSGLLKYTAERSNSEFIVLTEEGIVHQMKKISKGSKFYLVVTSAEDGGCTSCNKCPYMRLNTIEKIYLSLTKRAPQIHLNEDVRVAAKKSLDLMLKMS